MENVEGIKFNGVNITDLRYYAIDAIGGRQEKKIQKMIDRLNKTCRAYENWKGDQCKKDKSNYYGTANRRGCSGE